MAPAPRQVLNLVRMALLSGVLVFGAVAYGVRKVGTMPPMEQMAAASLRTIGVIVWTVSLIALVGLRVRFRETVERSRDTRLPLVAWAIGEAPAMFGGAFLLLTGDTMVFTAGLLALLLSFALFPVPNRG